MTNARFNVWAMFADVRGDCRVGRGNSRRIVRMSSEIVFPRQFSVVDRGPAAPPARPRQTS